MKSSGQLRKRPQRGRTTVTFGVSAREPLPPPSGTREQKRLELRGLQISDWSKWKRLDKMTTAHQKRAEPTNHRAHCNRPSVSERKQNNKRHLAFTELSSVRFFLLSALLCLSVLPTLQSYHNRPPCRVKLYDGNWDLSFGRI